MVENEPRWFGNGSTAYLYHTDIRFDLIVAMHLLWIYIYAPQLDFP